MVTNTYTPILGGLEKSIRAFAWQIRKRGHKVVIVAPEYEGMPKNEKEVVRLPALQHFNGTDFSVNLPVPGQMSQLMDELRPDLIHSHHPFLMGDLALRLCGQYRLPLVFTYHTMFEQYTHYLPVDNDAAKRFMVELTVGYANLADQVIAPSESVRDRLLEQGVHKSIHVVPTGIEINRFRKPTSRRFREKFRIPKSAFVVGHVGRLAPEKNLEFLSKSAARFMAREKKSHFLIVGSGPSEEAIQHIFSRAGVAERVHFTGTLQGKDLVNVYHAMNVFAFASQSETQGMVLTEAMAAGVPVIAVDAPGVREVVRDGENGRLLKSENEKDFSDAVRWAARLPAPGRRKLKEAARRTAKEFSIESCALRALEVYKQARLCKRTSRRYQRSPWRKMMRRLKTELNMLANVGKATGAALLETVSSD